MTSVLTLVGLASLLAGGVVEGSLRYANVIRFRFTASLLVVPGLYAVCGKLLKRCNSRPALIFSPGKRDSRKEILGFESSGTYKYIGLHSGTRASVLNPLFESWLNFVNKPIKVTDSVMIRNMPNMGSKCTIGFTKCTKKNCSSRITVFEPIYLGFAILLEAGAVVLFAFMIRKGDAAGIVINAVNMIIYFMISLVVTMDEFCIPEPQPAKNVKPGDILVTDKANNKLWVVKGDEDVIQGVAQKEIETLKMCEEYIETTVYMLGTIVAIATILVVPIMSKLSQILIVAQFGVGLVSSMVFSSRDGERMLKRLFENHYSVEPVVKVFTNRTTAVAAVVLYTEASTEQIHSEILPVTDEFKNYREILSKMVQYNHGLQILKKKIESKEYDVHDNKTFAKIANEIAYAVPLASRYVYNDLNSWPGRLLADITEAFVEIYYPIE